MSFIYTEKKVPSQMLPALNEPHQVHELRESGKSLLMDVIDVVLEDRFGLLGFQSRIAGPFLHITKDQSQV